MREGRRYWRYRDTILHNVQFDTVLKGRLHCTVVYILHRVLINNCESLFHNDNLHSRAGAVTISNQRLKKGDFQQTTKQYTLPVIAHSITWLDFEFLLPRTAQEDQQRRVENERATIKLLKGRKRSTAVRNGATPSRAPLADPPFFPPVVTLLFGVFFSPSRREYQPRSPTFRADTDLRRRPRLRTSYPCPKHPA